MNINLTKKRNKILSILKQEQKILSAKEIHKYTPTVDLATIYRTLNLLTKEKIVKQVRLNNDGEALFEYQEQPHHHAVCNKCNKIVHFKTSENEINKLLSIKGFEIEDIELTVKGVCCQSGKTK